MVARLLLVRHGESVLGTQGRYAGRLDSPLSPNGRQEVLRLRSRLRRYHVDHVYSSDLRRCRETVELLAIGSPISFTPQLREINFGRWEGRTSEECARKYPSQYRRWLKDPTQLSPPGGESLQKLAHRIRRFVSRIAVRHRDGTVAVVTHGGAIRTLLVDDLRDLWGVVVPPACLIVHRRPLGWEDAS